LAGDSENVAIPGNVVCGGVWYSRTSRSGSSKGSGLKAAPRCAMLKMAVLAPMPSQDRDDRQREQARDGTRGERKRRSEIQCA
jgi:hypothetical protein